MIELRESLDGLHVHALYVDELLADLLELRILGFDERKQGGPALLHECFLIEGDATDLVEGLPVAEDDVELTGLVLRVREVLGDRGDEGLPGGGLGRLAPTAERGGDAGDDLGLAVRHGGGVREELVQRRGVLVGAFGDAPRDELGDLRDATDVRAVDEVGERELPETGPNEQRQVMVRGVLIET